MNRETITEIAKRLNEARSKYEGRSIKDLLQEEGIFYANYELKAEDDNADTDLLHCSIVKDDITCLFWVDVKPETNIVSYIDTDCVDIVTEGGLDLFDCINLNKLEDAFSRLGI